MPEMLLGFVRQQPIQFSSLILLAVAGQSGRSDGYKPPPLQPSSASERGSKSRVLRELK